MYITESDIENYLMQDIDPSASAWVTKVIDMVEDYIDNYCDAEFSQDLNADRYYDGSGTNEIIIDDCETVHAVQIFDADGNVIHNLTENDDYYLYPLNDDLKNRIVLKPSGGQICCFPSYERAVKVNADYGYSAVPDEIKLAAVQLAGKILEKGLKGGQASGERLGEYQISYKEIDEAAESGGILNILDSYSMIRL